MSVQEKNSVVNDYQLKQKRLVAEFTITGDATPASKVHGVPDLPGVMILRTEGKTADADAVETVSFTTADDDSTGDSVFGILIKGGSDGLGDIRKVLRAQITDRGGSATSVAIAGTSDSTKGLTADGNLAFNVTGTGLNLSSENADLVVTIDYVAE
jgi:hypothetical protein